MASQYTIKKIHRNAEGQPDILVEVVLQVDTPDGVVITQRTETLQYVGKTVLQLKQELEDKLNAFIISETPRYTILKELEAYEGLTFNL